MVRFAVLAAVLLSGCVARERGVEPARGGGRDIELAAGWHVDTGRVAPRATLAALLRGHGISKADIAATIARVAGRFDVRRVRAAQPYRITRAVDGALRSLDYDIDADRALHVHREPGGDLAADVTAIPKSRHRVVVRGTIDRASPSLFAAMDAAGESIDLSVALAEIFAGEIDFSTELQPGDRFEVIVEKEYRDPEKTFSGYGPILAAQFDNAGRRVRAFRFAPGGSAAGYYDERGVSMRRFFLKSPLKFEPVVTSAFSRSRFHPILREYRAHLGVDYKAPAGAPVIAVADGLVLQAETSGGAGRFVHLRHANGYETEVPAPVFDDGSAGGSRASGRLHWARRVERSRHRPTSGLPREARGRICRSSCRPSRDAAGGPVPADQMTAFLEIEGPTAAAFGVDGATGPGSHPVATPHHQ